jgi:hypothetical protein
MQPKMIQAVDSAIANTEKLLSHADNPLLRAFVSELQRYKTLVENHWPLTNMEKETVDIGRVAVRELDDVYPDYVTELCQLGAALREEE